MDSSKFISVKRYNDANYGILSLTYKEVILNVDHIVSIDVDQNGFAKLHTLTGVYILPPEDLKRVKAVINAT